MTRFGDSSRETGRISKTHGTRSIRVIRYRVRKRIMTKTAEHKRRYVILDSNRDRFKRFLSSTVYFCKTQAEIGKVYDDVSDDLTWVTYTQKFTDEFLKAVTRGG